MGAPCLNRVQPRVVRAGGQAVRRCTTCAALAQSAGQLRSTPHSGYHYDGRRSRFFEGWYFKASNHPKDLLRWILLLCAPAAYVPAVSF